MFRGREQSRPELGYRLLQRLAADVQEIGSVESAPKQDGRNMIMVLGPTRKKSEVRAEREAERRRHDADQAGDRTASTTTSATTAAAPPAPAEPAEAETGTG
jgi:translation initiation factor IF-3